MSAFEPALDIVLAHEGGWTDDPRDPGGATNRGITMGIFREWAGEHASKEQLHGLSVEDAAAIYRAEWWDRYGYDRIHDQDCATKIFDSAVNLGPKRAHRLAQEACQKLGHPALIADGVFGPATVEAINSCDPRAWLRGMCCELREFYEGLIVEKPALDAFRAGWLRRASWPYSAEAAV